VRETRKLESSDYTLLVTFTDMTGPQTVQKADPDNLAATFGPGVLLKRITAEIADGPLTEGKIESVLGWLNDIKKIRLIQIISLTNTVSEEIGYLRRKSS
jgi:hypothetical protein